MFADQSQFYRNLAIQFYGANRDGSNVSQGVLDQFWSWSMQSGLKNSYECVKSLAETDFTDDLERFDVPTLLIHGDDDQVVPVGNSMKSARIIKNTKDIYYPGAARHHRARTRTRSTRNSSRSCRASRAIINPKERSIM